MELTTHILTQNNELTIEAAITSLSHLECEEIIVGDLESTDRTTEIASDLGAKVIPISHSLNYGNSRNHLASFSKTEWQFYMEPWEVLNSNISLSGDAIKVYVQYKDVLTKELRLWRKSTGRKFVRPIYEGLEPDHGQLANVFILSKGGERQDVEAILRQWKESSPTTKDIAYYESFFLLSKGKYLDFLRTAELYLFRETEQSVPAILTRYYCALVQLKVNNIGEAVRSLLPALAAKPLLAELWCLLGDCFVKLKQYFRASIMYENALILGSKRKNDDYPIEVAKYLEYPQTMIEEINKLYPFH